MVHRCVCKWYNLKLAECGCNDLLWTPALHINRQSLFIYSLTVSCVYIMNLVVSPSFPSLSPLPLLLTSNSPPTLMPFACTTEFNGSCLHEHGLEVIYWSMGLHYWENGNPLPANINYSCFPEHGAS